MPYQIPDPEIELIIAVYRRARQDYTCGSGREKRLAGWFLKKEGFDLGEVRDCWRDKPPQRREKRQ